MTKIFPIVELIIIGTNVKTENGKVFITILLCIQTLRIALISVINIANKEIIKIWKITIPKNPKKLISYIPRYAGPISFPVIITPKDNIIKILIATIIIYTMNEPITLILNTSYNLF